MIPRVYVSSRQEAKMEIKNQSHEITDDHATFGDTITVITWSYVPFSWSPCCSSCLRWYTFTRMDFTRKLWAKLAQRKDNLAALTIYIPFFREFNSAFKRTCREIIYWSVSWKLSHVKDVFRTSAPKKSRKDINIKQVKKFFTIFHIFHDFWSVSVINLSSILYSCSKLIKYFASNQFICLFFNLQRS